MRIRKNDQVVLAKRITGARQVEGRPVGKEEKGSVARVLKVIADKDKVIVEGVNYVWRHVRRSQKHPQGGRITKEAPIPLSAVMLYCPKCGGPTRVKKQIIEKQDAAGKRRREVIRLCKKCGEGIGGAH